MVSGRSAMTMTVLGAAAAALSVLSGQWLLAVVSVATAAAGLYWWQRRADRAPR